MTGLAWAGVVAESALRSSTWYVRTVQVEVHELQNHEISVAEGALCVCAIDNGPVIASANWLESRIENTQRRSKLCTAVTMSEYLRRRRRSKPTAILLTAPVHVVSKSRPL